MASPLVVINTTSSLSSMSASTKYKSGVSDHARQQRLQRGRTVSQETRNHELRSVADGVDGGILNDDSLVSGEQRFERSNDSSEVGFCEHRG